MVKRGSAERVAIATRGAGGEWKRGAPGVSGAAFESRRSALSHWLRRLWAWPGADRQVERREEFVDTQTGGPEDTKAFHNIGDMELSEEWQDEDPPRLLPEDMASPAGGQQGPTDDGDRQAPPQSLALSGSYPRKKRLVAPTLSLTLDRSDSVFSEDFTSAALSPSPDDDEDLDINLDAMETPSDSESCTFPGSMVDLEWEDDLPRTGRVRGGALRSSMQEQVDTGHLELDQVDSRGRRWRRFHIAGQECRVDMTVLEPYLQVLSHGGYYGEGMNAVIVLSSCYLPENTIEDYQYVMDNLFRYIVGTLDLMVSENYVMVYLCGMAPRSKMPNIKWLRQCYTTIDRRLRKNLKGLFVVHPIWYIKALITIIKPFVSRKLHLVHSLRELARFLPMERVQIPDCVRRFDESIDR
ncbi:bcl-2/adenovirus E1B 19 kDa-interacting protein 2-like protein-like [Scleropages formosus]|uniref:Bcl-2/adenovirus E1B 19 kDa-interacting protein 2-like protein-like n=1 Tax=Scleropages formosus TaxID=113540 RepID=A0A0P7V9I1_SCLFO|nr:bcl-2/adenovirus E1B 19 kDa-interacting protein 2-like protein-like [Scleropages formosus]